MICKLISVLFFINIIYYFIYMFDHDILKD